MNARNESTLYSLSASRLALTWAVGPLLLGVGCYFALRLSIALRLPPAGVATVWFPGGLLLGALLVLPPRRWAAYLVCAFAALAVAYASGGRWGRPLFSWQASSSPLWAQQLPYGI